MLRHHHPHGLSYINRRAEEAVRHDGVTSKKECTVDTNVRLEGNGGRFLLFYSYLEGPSPGRLTAYNKES